MVTAPGQYCLCSLSAARDIARLILNTTTTPNQISRTTDRGATIGKPEQMASATPRPKVSAGAMQHHVGARVDLSKFFTVLGKSSDMNTLRFMKAALQLLRHESGAKDDQARRAAFL